MFLKNIFSIISLSLTLTAIPCYAVNSLEILKNTPYDSKLLCEYDNGLYFIERNPSLLKVHYGDNPAAYTGIYKYPSTGYVYCYKDGIPVKFDGTTNGLLYIGDDHQIYSSDDEITQVFHEFLKRYENDYGYDDIFWRTDNIIKVNAFEQILQQYLHNSLLSAGQENILNISTDASKSYFEISLKSKDTVDKFKKNFEITNTFLAECDSLVANAQSQKEIVTIIDAIICNRLEYASQEDLNPLTGYPYTELDVICDQKKTVCAGYCNLFKLLCERYGIITKTVENMVEMNHAWNACFIDGEWYYTDTTWNDTTRTKEFLLKSKDTFSDTHIFPTELS